jgi:hypothetical protein
MAEQHPNVYWTADRSALVEEGDERAAFLAYARADSILPEHLSLLHGKAPEAKAPVIHRKPSNRRR